MAQITSGIGLVSGINTAQIINELMSLESAPEKLLQTQVANLASQKQAYGDISTSLGTLNDTAKTLGADATFQQSAATSSNENVLTATAGVGAATGSFQFQVARLVSTQEAISTGFVDPTSAKIGAGSITIGQGGGGLSVDTPLSQLNGGAGVRRGQFRITDRTGKTDIIDISNAITLNDAVRKINNALDISVHASVQGDGLVLADTSGQSTSNLIVQDLGDGNAAKDLGIVASTGAQSITGTNINSIGVGTSLSSLNDGRGVGTASGAVDFRITDSAGANHDVTVNNLANVGDVISAINTAGAGAVTAALGDDGHSIKLIDTGGGSITVAAQNGSSAAKDLGILGSASGTLAGATILSPLNSVLLSSLNGGQGLSLGSFLITDKAGHTTSADLSGAKTVQQMIDAINTATASGATGVTASLNSAQSGIQLTDTSNGSGNLIVAENGGTTAATLGLLGSTSKNFLSGSNLHRQWVTTGTLLSSLNGGKGIDQSQFSITDSTGATAEIDLSTGNTNTVGNLISLINLRGIGVTASINSNGNGILLTDTAGGAAKLKVADDNGTAARDLNVAGTAAATTLDGAYEKTIAIDLNDTLTTLQNKINQAGFAVGASIINDGSNQAPFRLSITSDNSGKAGQFIFDTGNSNIQVNNLVEAQDAAVFIGGSSAAQPLLVTSSKNQLSNVINGVTVNLLSISDSPVQLSITRSSDNVVTQVQTLTDTFNAVIGKIATDTKFDTTTNQGGVLLGDSTAQQVQYDIYQMLQAVVTSNSKYRILADVGLTLDDKSNLKLDQDKFKAAYADDPQQVQALFAQATTGVAAVMQKQLNKLIDPVNGSLTLQNRTIDQQTKNFQDRITEMNAILDQKRTQLERQFANMESVLAGLMSQQSALSSIGTISSAPKPSSSSSSGSTSSTSSSGG